MNMTADLAALTSRGKKSEVNDVDSSRDVMEFDVLVLGKEALTIKNALVESSLELDPSGLRVAGTNQRWGMVGSVEIPPGGRIFLRRNVFEIQSGVVRFNDPNRLRPEFDVRARTEYRRFQSRSDSGGTNEASAGATSVPVAGTWRIALHAYGPAEEMKIDLTSDPALAQDDIFLLLTVGLTRTELDRMQSSGVGSSVALEALGTVSGAESAVTETVPIDEFRFGSSYSSRSGRTEPTVTLGKRLTDRIRASVTTSLSDANEVRSIIEYRATPQLSVEGNFDNAQRAGGSSLGNLGADVRWQIEFD